MNETERVLLALVEQHLRVWRCRYCGGRWLTGISERALFHACEPGRARRLFERRSVELDDGWPETREEATAALYADFAKNFDEDAFSAPEHRVKPMDHRTGVRGFS